MAVPERLDWPAAGGVPEVFTTAHDALFTQCGLLAGERLLVHGGAGGVGTAAIGLGAAAGRACTRPSQRGTARRRRSARREGARARGLRRARALRCDPRARRRGQPRSQPRRARIAGRIAVIGIGAGAVAEIDLRMLMGKRARIHGSMLRARPPEDKALTARRVERSVLPARRRHDHGARRRDLPA